MEKASVVITLLRDGQLQIQSELPPPLIATVLRKALQFIDEHAFAATVQQMQTIQIASQLPPGLGR